MLPRKGGDELATGLRAGAAEVPLDPPIGVPLMGYALREGVARAHRDPLHVRAVYLEAGGAVLWIALDLCLLAPGQAAAIRGAVSRRTGLPRERVVVACVHTHSGPETGYAAWLGGVDPPTHVPALLEKAVEAGVRAPPAAAPARLGAQRTAAHIGINRRRAGAPIDETVCVLRVDRADGSPLAVLYTHGCHATVLGHENLDYSVDWPAAAGRAIGEALPGAVPIFALAAHADVDPRTRGLMDLAIDGQSAGAGFEDADALGTEIGEAVGAAAANVRTSRDTAVDVAHARVPLPVHGAELPVYEREQRMAARRAAALGALDLPEDAQVRSFELYRLASERTAELPPAERRERIARVRLYLRDRTAPRFAGGVRPPVELVVLAVGPWRHLALPLEATVDVGLDWRSRLRAPDTAVLGIANGWLRYLPHERTFGEPDAHHQYEVLQSTFAPDAATRLLTRGEELAATLAAG